MPTTPVEYLLARIGDVQTVASAVNGAASIVIAAPGAKKRIVLVSVILSASDAPAAPVSFTIDSAGASDIIERLELPAAQFAPIPLPGMYRGDINQGLTLTLPALGDGVRGTVSARYRLVPTGDV